LAEYDAPTRKTYLERIRHYIAGGAAKNELRAILRKAVFRWMIARNAGDRVKDGKMEMVQLDEANKLMADENNVESQASKRGRPDGGDKVRGVAGFLDGLGVVLDVVNTYKDARANNRGFWDQAHHDNAKANSVLPGIRFKDHPELFHLYPGDA
jgi:hypothetical protein